jgi:hypothetical protein
MDWSDGIGRATYGAPAHQLLHSGLRPSSAALESMKPGDFNPGETDTRFQGKAMNPSKDCDSNRPPPQPSPMANKS